VRSQFLSCIHQSCLYGSSWLTWRRSGCTLDHNLLLKLQNAEHFHIMSTTTLEGHRSLKASSYTHRGSGADWEGGKWWRYRGGKAPRALSKFDAPLAGFGLHFVIARSDFPTITNQRTPPHTHLLPTTLTPQQILSVVFPPPTTDRSASSFPTDSAKLQK
jgi:hypothetical protein